MSISGGVHRISVFGVLIVALISGNQAYAVRKKNRSLASKVQLKEPKQKPGMMEPVINVGPLDELKNSLYLASSNRRVLDQIRKAQDLLKKRKFDAARRAASVVKSDADFGDYARWIAADANLSLAPVDLNAKHFAKVRIEALEVINLLGPIPQAFPYSPLNRWLPRAVGRANLMLGQVFCQEKKWVDCRKQYEAGLERLSITEALVYVRPEDIHAYAGACSHRGPELCRAWLQRLAMVYPHNTLEYKALAQDLPQFVENPPRGSSYGRTTIPYRLGDPDTAALDDAMEKYLGHKEKDAIQAFRKLLDEYPRSSSRFRAKYWLAQAMIHEKRPDDGKRLLLELQQASPLTYYGLLAAIATGSDIENQIKSASPKAQDDDPMLSPLDLVRLRRAQALISQRAYEPAAIELRDFKPREGLSNPFLIYLAMLQSEAGAHASAFQILNELVTRGDASVATLDGLDMIFPTEHFNEITAQALQFELDPILGLSLIKQESAFDPGAISNTGALGLMQLMPSTASDLFSDLTRSDIVSPDANLRIGMKYLSQLLHRFHGNIVYALAAYNAGPGAVNRWMKASPPGCGMLEFIESIPFKETREYVSAIIRNYFWYSRRIGTRPENPLNLEYFWKANEPESDSEDNGGTSSDNADRMQPSPGPSPDLNSDQANGSKEGEVFGPEAPVVPHPLPGGSEPSVHGNAESPSPKPSY